MRTVLAVLAIATMALAGCSSKPDLYTCKVTSHVVDLSKVDGSGKKGFDPESACPPIVKPSVAIVDLPANATVYFPITLAWTVDSGNYTGGHSMLTQLMWSHHPIATETLKEPATFSTNPLLGMYQHQDVPQKFTAKYKFQKAQAYYLRAYAQVRGNPDLPDGDYWSPEVKFVVAAVNFTGKAITVSHDQGPGLGGTVGKLTSTASNAALGDWVVLQNKDATAHKFTFSGVCQKYGEVTVGATPQSSHASSATRFLMDVFGACTITTDDAPQTQAVSINVQEPM